MIRRRPVDIPRHDVTAMFSISPYCAAGDLFHVEREQYLYIFTGREFGLRSRETFLLSVVCLGNIVASPLVYRVAMVRYGIAVFGLIGAFNLPMAYASCCTTVARRLWVALCQLIGSVGGDGEVFSVNVYRR